jgi:hypothetical protein
MRYLVAIFVVALPLAAHAQRHAAPRPGPVAPQRPVPVVPATPVAPPPVIVPFQQLPPQPAGGLTTGFPFTFPDRFNPPPDLFRVNPLVNPYRMRGSRLGIGGYGGGYYGGSYIGAPESVPASTQAPSPPPPPGMLRFSVTPLSAQVFVDSYYVGTIEDIDNQRVLTLQPGPHRVEIRAAEYEPVTFDVRIESNDTVTYRATLERSQRQAPPRGAAPSGPTRMYVIPNCYLGNIPPRQDRLPSGCSTKQVRVIGD